MTTASTTVERPQPGWTVASRSARGVMVDFRNVVVGPTTFRVLRLRARTTLLRWHVGSSDPTLAPRAPRDAGPAIDWPVEGRAGVVAVFNGAFKQAAGAGGSIADGMTLVPMLAGRMTIAIDAAGSWTMGRWGTPGFPPRGFSIVSARQNLGALVWNRRVTAAALSANWRQWGDTIGEVPAVARSGLGVDAKGDLLYVATMQPITAATLARALVAAGAVTAMELDINPLLADPRRALLPAAPTWADAGATAHVRAQPDDLRDGLDTRLLRCPGRAAAVGLCVDRARGHLGPRARGSAVAARRVGLWTHPDPNDHQNRRIASHDHHKSYVIGAAPCVAWVP